MERIKHDNARPHCARRTMEKNNELGWEVLLHPPYTPDIAPSDIHLFRSLLHFLCDNKFESFGDIQNAISRYFAQNQLIFIDPALHSEKETD